ncbi:hypothetical protein D9611_004756 [Ephemerocybe angulata]|uniref:Autophagy-related protein 2 n=1 Tax=Ephemerocybe angulata TaxID=980116 RepID=A0A8H5EXT0_9AGAR|nr:hypothetical protein D9611_004756 [Tulosesus angulatus]
MSWFPSWLPSLPSLNFPVPAGIQGRFVSFVLKRSLGHLFKPGQLSSPQIDSQIGSGYVQVNDLEFDELAINGYLEGIPLTLESGSIQAVTARIPWPNPLTSTIGLSAKSLHLKLRIDNSIRQSRQPGVDLAESVISVAESFVHNELSSQEEAGLWESMHSVGQEVSEENGVPGGLDPFISSEEELQMDPAGVSLFASLIERLLARFEFDAEDIQITLTDPDNLTLRFSLAEIRYSTTQGEVDSSGIRRTLTLQALELFTTNHVHFSTPTSPSTPTPHSPVRPGNSSAGSSRRSSSSSMDEETEMQMSQSIAMLPRRPISPSQSMNSSIYHSIIDSSVPPVSPRVKKDGDPELAPSIPTTILEECFLSFGTAPVVIHITTPPPGAAHSEPRFSKDTIEVDIRLGVLAAAIQPWQVLGIGRLAEKLMDASERPHTPHQRPNKPDSLSSAYSIELGLDLRAISVLVSSSFGHTDDTPSPLTPHFNQPFTPPSLTTGYTRLLIDSVSGHVSISPTELSCNVGVAEISALQFLAAPNDDGVATSQPSTIPVLITDPYLPLQYEQQHRYTTRGASDSSCPQPRLTVLDWRDPKFAKLGSKLSPWKSRPPKSTPHHTAPGKDNDSKVKPCLMFSLERTSSTRTKHLVESGLHIQVDVSPLHIMVDLEMAHKPGGIFRFVQDLSLEQAAYRYSYPPNLNSAEEDDFLSSDDETYGRPGARSDAQRSPEPRRDNEGSNTVAKLSIAMIRTSVIVPPPLGCQRRSGVVILDLHDINVSNAASPNPSQVRFDSTASQHYAQDPGDPFVEVRCRRVVVGCSSVSDASALAMVSVGPLTDNSDPYQVSLPPVIRAFQPNTGSDKADPKTSVAIEVPSVFLSVSKEQWDALQYWIDDLSQALERLNTASKDLSESKDSRNASLIGSRYFSKSQRESTFDSSKAVGQGIKIAISFNVAELHARCSLPRNNPAGVEVRPFNITGSDFSAQIELHANGKLSAAVTFMDALVEDTPPSGQTQTFLSLTSARSLTSLPRPIIKLRFISSIIPETTAKESKLSLTLCNFTFDAYPDIQWVKDFIAFSKSPPGTFEAVVPTERTCISLKIVDGSLRAFAPNHPGALVLSIGGLHFATDIIGDSKDTSFRLDIASLAALSIDNLTDAEHQRVRKGETDAGAGYWKTLGYALLAEVTSTKLHYQESKGSSPEKQILVDGTKLRIHACADTFASVGAFVGDLSGHFKAEDTDTPHLRVPEPAVLSPTTPDGSTLTGSIDDLAFRKVPEIGPTPDMIYDDLPTNLDYLDESFGAAAGLRELTDDDLDEFDIRDIAPPTAPVTTSSTGVVSSVGGETIKILHGEGINIIEDYYDHLPRETIDERPASENELLRVRIRNCDIALLLYDGYDWPRTRRTIEEEVKEMRKRLAKIRQLVASGQTQEPIPEDTSALLFNSVYIGLHQDVDATEPEALIAAIDEELRDDFEVGSQSSWQTLQHPISTTTAPRPSVRIHGKRLTRARGPSMEFCLSGLNAELNKYGGTSVVVSRTFATVRDLEILDHIKTSTWKKFLTALRSDSKGNIRETGANMVRIELHSVRPSLGHTSEEARLRAKILPLRLYVDQDAVDFLKKFFSFKDPDETTSAAPSSPPEQEAYIQMAEIFPIDLKLDYKPRRVDYRALREGKTIELMNFFHFDGAEMTLRHITLSGVTGWPKLFEMLNDLWTPDVKATQLVEVISGVAPIRSMVNVGSGVADLVLLPISQYRKDGRIVRGVQKGATAFVKSTALEAIKLGARLATGTQVILEQAEGVLGGDFENTVTAETLQPSFGDDFNLPGEDFDDDAEHISKYAQQPADIREGVQSAYKSLHRNLSSAAQTILAVPMEVYERSGNEGPVRSVIRAVPIAVLKPMIGATEAVSKTLLGLHNTLDPDVRHENEAKYKNR